MIHVAHIIKQINEGGGTLGLARQCIDSAGFASHSVLSIKPPDSRFVDLFHDVKVAHLNGTNLRREMSQADVVQVEWWNNPEVNDALLNGEFPECRIVLNSRVHPDSPLMCPSVNLLRRVDYCFTTVPGCLENNAFMANVQAAGLPIPRCVFSASQEIPSVSRRGRNTDRVIFGYLGTVEPFKLYPDFLNIVEEILVRVPEATFRFAGEGLLDEYRAEVARRKLDGAVEFLGRVTDVEGFLRDVDVFFYPLNKFTYATSEKALQEAMFSGLPCVVFPHGGVRDVAEREAGLLVESPEAFSRKCVDLARNQDFRLNAGERAQSHIQGLKLRSDAMDSLRAGYLSTLQLPKRPRPALHILPDDLLNASTHLEISKESQLSDIDLNQYRYLVEFTRGEYQEWQKRSRASFFE